jgi:hypothetical protein
MTIGTVFTLFVVPVFYSLIAAQHRRQDAEAVSNQNVSAQLPGEWHGGSRAGALD